MTFEFRLALILNALRVRAALLRLEMNEKQDENTNGDGNGGYRNHRYRKGEMCEIDRRIDETLSAWERRLKIVVREQ